MNPTQRTQLERGVVLWNEGRFFEAHDAWEEAWRAASGEEKTLFQGLIQAAAALVKWQRNEARGAFRLLTAAIDKLYGIEESAGVAVDPLIDALAALRTEAEKAVAASPTAADLPADIAFPRLGYSPPDAAAESLGGLSVFPRARCPYCGEEWRWPWRLWARLRRASCRTVPCAAGRGRYT